MLEMTSNAGTNAGKHVTTNIAYLRSQQYSIPIGPNDLCYDITYIPACCRTNQYF